MIIFYYVGISKSGQQVTGMVQAQNALLAKINLLQQGISVKKLRKKRNLFNKIKISPSEIAAFTRQLATLVHSGIPLVPSLAIIEKEQKNHPFQQIIQSIKLDIETGIRLAAALRKHPSCFNELFCNLVHVGEQSGTLDVLLEHIANYKEKIENLKKKIKKALAYPLAIVIIGLAVTLSLLVFVIPQFEALFKGFDADLPMITKALINTSQCVQSYWYLIFSPMAAFIWIVNYYKKHSDSFAYTIDRLLLKLPLIGPLLEKAALARFSRTLAITYAAGLPLTEALQTIADSIGNIIFAKTIKKISDKVSVGEPLTRAMEETTLFPHRVIQMIAIGEESGSLEKMLSKLADAYEEEVSHSIEVLNTLLEPLVMTFLGLLIGGLVLAMYLPVFKLGSLL